MSPQDRRGIKLIDVVFAILVIGILVGVVLPRSIPVTKSVLAPSVSTTCGRSALALINFSTSKNHFPNAGTFRDDGRHCCTAALREVEALSAHSTRVAARRRRIVAV